jgi:hypothetical protein
VPHLAKAALICLISLNCFRVLYTESGVWAAAQGIGRPCGAFARGN